MKHIRTRTPASPCRRDRSPSALRGKLFVSLVAFALTASALASGEIQWIELTVMLAFLSVVVISNATALRMSRQRKHLLIDGHLERLRVRLMRRLTQDVGPWGIRDPLRNVAPPAATERTRVG